MNKNNGFRLAAIAMVAALTSGGAVGQHIVGGMGEKVRLGAFSGEVVEQRAANGPIRSHGAGATASAKARTKSAPAAAGPGRWHGRIALPPGKQLP